MSNTKKFRVVEVLDAGIGLGDVEAPVLPSGWRACSHEMTSKGRWSVRYRQVFQEPSQVGTDEAWAFDYEIGATENQDGDYVVPLDEDAGDDDEMGVYLVKAIPAVKWVKAK